MQQWRTPFTLDNAKPLMSTAGKSVVLSSYREVLADTGQDDAVSDGDADTESAPFEVERVVDHRLAGGTIEFLLRWKGYGPEDDTWTPESEMSCHNLVEEYFHTLGAAQQL